MMSSAPWAFGFCFVILSCYSATARYDVYNATANLSTTWIVTNDDYYHEDNRIFVRTSTVDLVFGFLNQSSASFLLAMYLVPHDINLYYYTDTARVVWSANRDHLVRSNATLNFTAAGELVLRDVDGSLVWSTDTARKSVAGMNLTEAGNLVLFDIHNSVVWQSFDHPTDCLLLGQQLFQGQRLKSSVLLTNWTTSQEVSHSIRVTHQGLFAYVESSPPQTYYRKFFIVENTSNKGRSYVSFLNGSLSLFVQSGQPKSSLYVLFNLPYASSRQYMKLSSDGHLKVFEWNESEWKWEEVADLLGDHLGACDYPLVCGRNSICLDNQQCGCPSSSSTGKEYFKLVNGRQPNLGCSEIIPLTCNSTQDQDFISIENVNYISLIPDMEDVTVETCKEACMNNCSCKAAIFKNKFEKFENESTSASGDCYLPQELFSMVNTDTDRDNQTVITAFLKVQNSATSLHHRASKVALIGSMIGGFVLLFIGVITFIMLYKRIRDDETEEEYLDQVPGMPMRFSYDELNVATENFSRKLGEGGFGSVFEGTLDDGSKIAVKRLEGVAHVKKSFLAEVESIGSIHHLCLVRLRGFCAWKSQRLLVYEFMCNGSLDRWIYHGIREHTLKWEFRKNIILDIAKGLAYLHEECRQKIIHLDIKPQNILLDSNFNAKVSDFGLSKLIDRNQTQVMTTIKGTPGYMAPEWWSSVITEKVDVYSFGIVLLEIICGRKIFDRSLHEESWHLLSVFQKCWEQGTLLDMVDKCSEDMQSRDTEVVEMMKVASWCLQTDFTRRPSMSSVVKVLEGVMNVETDLDYNFTDPRMQKTAVGDERELKQTQLFPSLLSGPR